MTERLAPAAIASLAGQSLLVIGDLILDEYLWGEVRRISPEAPVPVVDVRRQSFVPGGAANVAANIAALGSSPLLGGVVGSDESAQRLGEALGRAGVGCSGVVTCRDRSTTVKTRVIAHSQQVVRLDVEQSGALELAAEEQLLAWVARTMPAVTACVISDYAKGVVSPCLAQHVIAAARRLGKPVVVDPKGRDYARYHGATVVKPNRAEAELVCGRSITGDDGSLAAAGQQLTALLGGAAVAITCGSQGLYLWSDHAPPITVGSVAQHVYDVTGAGDTVTCVLALALGAGLALPQAAWLANLAAGVVVGKVGTATVTPDELVRAADRHSGPSASMMNETAHQNRPQ